MLGASRPAYGTASESALLLEREHELTLFDQLLQGGVAESGGVVVVEGPAGIGKSRLISELRSRATAADLRVLAANGSDLEREFPFGIVRQLFEPLLVAREERRRLLEGAAGPAASVFESVPSQGAAGEDVSFAALHGLYWLTLNLCADEPLVLVVDDLHWCDRPSLRFLAYLARRLDGLGVLMLVGLRSAEPGTDPVMLGEIVGNPNAVHARPGPLSEAGVAEMVRTLLDAEPDPGFVAACTAATGGNPLLLRQLLSSLLADGVRPQAAQVSAVREIGPRAVSRTVLTRLRRLPPEAARVARAVAVLGTSAELPLVAELAELDEPGVAKLTAAMAQAEILRADPPLGFVHPLVRDAVYHDLPPGERALLHAGAAQLLVRAEASDEAIATQLLAAPPRREQWVVALLRRAAEGARRRGAADSAVAYLERALQEPPPRDQRTGVLLELGLAETLTSGRAATLHLREAWRALDEPAERAHVAATLARTLLFTAPAEEAVEVAGQALAETPDELVDERQALKALELMAVFFGARGAEEMTRLHRIEIEGEGPGAKMLAAIVAFCRSLVGASAQECVPLARRALADGVLIEVDPGLFPVAAISVLVMADIDDALVEWDRLRARAHRGGSLLGILTVGLWRGFTLMWRGELREADESLAGVEQDFLSWGLVQSSETYVPAFLGAVRILRGDLAGARDLLFGHPIEDSRTDGYRHLLRTRAELLLEEGQFEQALELAGDLAERYVFISQPGWSGWRSLRARALDGLGRREEALQAAQEEVAAARRWGASGLIGRSLALLGRIERERGLDHLREAVDLLEHSTAKYELAAAKLALGAALRHARRPADAREPLREALELAEQCGAQRLVDQARSELYAAGARPRSSALGGVEALTASERRVAGLAAEGRTNKEIAQVLYVTPKTVEVHLSSAYRKLDIRSRQELARAMAP